MAGSPRNGDLLAVDSLAPRVNAVVARDLVFIASGGRTGSMFLGKYLGQAIENCFSVHEPDMLAGLTPLTLRRIGQFGFRHMIVDRCLGKSGIRVLGQKRLQGKIDDRECFARIRKSRERYHDTISRDLVIESYYSWWLFARRINAIWPRAKMAGVIRDPRTWIDSWLRHSPTRRKSATRSGLLEPLVTPESLNDTRWAACWNEIGQAGRLAWDWLQVYRELDSAQQESARVKIFRFEDIFATQTLGLDAFLQFVTVHPDRQYRVVDPEILHRPPVNSSAGPGNSWHSWSTAQARTVDELCGSLMQRYGYGNEPEWRQLLAGTPG